MSLPVATVNHAFSATEMQSILDAIGNTVVLGSNQSVISSTTLVDISGFSFTLSNATGTYEWETLFFYDGAAAADLKLGLVVPTGATARWSAHSALSTDASAGGSFFNAGFTETGTPTMGCTGVGTTMIGLCKGVLTNTGNAGTFKMQMAQGVSTATNTTVFSKSKMTVKRVV